MTTAPDIRAFYTHPGQMTALPAALPSDMPTTIEDVFAIAPGVLLHRFWAGAYGDTLTPAREAQAQARSMAEILAGVYACDSAPLSRARLPAKRFVGVCRHFTVLTTALLRAQGVPARGRCGFATYFGGGPVDHWVVEYWDGARWKLGDSQLDTVQRKAINARFDPLDVPRDAFLVAADAWRACRSGDGDPETFGIMDLRGLWFVAGNVMRDLAALNNAEMLPWDVWGLMPQPGEEIAPRVLARIDQAAALTADPDKTFDAMRALYRDEAFRVPTQVMNAQTGRFELV
jgi:hypothetical protein